MGTPLEEDLASWGHHFTSNSVPDTILQASAGDEVSCLSACWFNLINRQAEHCFIRSLEASDNFSRSIKNIAGYICIHKPGGWEAHSHQIKS